MRRAAVMLGAKSQSCALAAIGSSQPNEKRVDARKRGPHRDVTPDPPVVEKLLGKAIWILQFGSTLSYQLCETFLDDPYFVLQLPDRRTQVERAAAS